MNFKKILLFGILGLSVIKTNAQCCAGGSGSPIAGGASQGVLMLHQVDLNTNFQYILTRKFLTGDKPAEYRLDMDHFTTNYIYSRLGLGITKNFTLYLETGYFLNKTQVTLNKAETIKSKGIGDLIIFPRYDIINKTKRNRKTELTVGIGFKIPLGKYNDSMRKIEPFSGDVYYIRKPLAVQPSSGAQDIIFYTFYLKDYSKFRIFTNATYIKRGWNAMGEKHGNFMSVGLFASKTFFKSLGVTLQVRGEWVDKMKLNKNILLYAYPNYDPAATGYKKIFFAPQVSYTYQRKITVYALTEIPIYQYVTKTQIASQYQATLGVSYRFMLKEKASK